MLLVFPLFYHMHIADRLNSRWVAYERYMYCFTCTTYCILCCTMYRKLLTSYNYVFGYPIHVSDWQAPHYQKKGWDKFCLFLTVFLHCVFALMQMNPSYFAASLVVNFGRSLYHLQFAYTFSRVLLVLHFNNNNSNINCFFTLYH